MIRPEDDPAAAGASSSHADLWTLDPEVAYLNHGSFGACPRQVLEFQAELRAQLEREPARPKYLLSEPGVGYRLKIS